MDFSNLKLSIVPVMNLHYLSLDRTVPTVKLVHVRSQTAPKLRSLKTAYAFFRYSYDPSQHNDTSVRSSVRTTEGLESHDAVSRRMPEWIPAGQSACIFGDVGDKYEETIFDMKPPCDGFIDSRAGSFFGPTLIVIPLTTELKKLNQPTHYVLQKQRGLEQISMSESEQLVTINKTQVIKYLGKTDQAHMRKIDDCLRISLHLNPEGTTVVTKLVLKGQNE